MLLYALCLYKGDTRPPGSNSVKHSGIELKYIRKHVNMPRNISSNSTAVPAVRPRKPILDTKGFVVVSLLTGRLCFLNAAHLISRRGGELTCLMHTAHHLQVEFGNMPKY